jgi:hypothetical protein
MLTIIPSAIREMPESWRERAAVRRGDTPVDPVADAYEKAARELEAAIDEAQSAARLVTAREFAELRGVREGTVRKWCARGELTGATKNISGDWRIPVTASRVHHRRSA